MWKLSWSVFLIGLACSGCSAARPTASTESGRDLATPHLTESSDASAADRQTSLPREDLPAELSEDLLLVSQKEMGPDDVLQPGVGKIFQEPPPVPDIP